MDRVKYKNDPMGGVISVVHHNGDVYKVDCDDPLFQIPGTWTGEELLKYDKEYYREEKLNKILE